MLRELQVTMNKPANAMYKAGEEKMTTGMAVVKNEAKKTFEFAEAETSADLFFVDKERVPSGANAAREIMSDYDTDFATLNAGEPGILVAYYPGERIAVDQYVAEGLTEGVRVSAGVDGKLKKATVASKYVFKEFTEDNGHKLAIIEISDSEKANA